ncbi:hypothetical protein SHIRM173S_06604 [Streptomyces hirsutus]
MTVYFIGAGPGAADLITVRGARTLAACGVCLYAGSLVPRELLAECPPGALRDELPGGTGGRTPHRPARCASAASEGPTGSPHGCAGTRWTCSSTRPTLSPARSASTRHGPPPPPVFPCSRCDVPAGCRSRGDVWHETGSLTEAAGLLSALGRRVFLTTGRMGLAAFAPLDDLWFLVRSVDAPEAPHPPCMEVLLDRGPFTLDGERELLRRHRIDVVVTKDSGERPPHRN